MTQCAGFTFGAVSPIPFVPYTAQLHWSDNWIGDTESRARYNGERQFNYVKVIGHYYASWATL